MAYQRQQHVEIMDQMPPTAQGPVDVSPRSTAHEAINTRPWLIPSYPIPPEMKYIGISIPQLRCPTTKRMKIFGGFWRHWITMLNHVESSIYIIYHISYICLLGPKMVQRLRAPVPCAASGVHSHIYLHTCHGGRPKELDTDSPTKHPPHSSSKFCFCAQLPLLNSRSPAWHTIPKKNWYSRIQMRLIGGEARPRHDCQFFDGTLKGPNTNLNMLCGSKKNC